MNILNNLKKSAMFGLDARIALAIFAALSVVSGAVLFKALSNIKITKIASEFSEIAKAYEAMYLDIHNPYNGCYVFINNPPVPGWKGPYLWESGMQTNNSCTGTPVFTISNFPDPVRDIYNKNNINRNLPFKLQKASKFDTSLTTIAHFNNNCTTERDCAVYYNGSMTTTDIDIRAIKELKTILKKIDEAIDGNNSPFEGKFRYSTEEPAPELVFFNWAYLIIPVANPS